MCSKRNGAASVRCHPAMNWPISVASTGLWASCEPLRRHVLKIVRPYIFRDVYRFEIPPNRNIVPALETLSLAVVFAFFYASTKNHATYFTQSKITFRNVNFCLKNLVLFLILPSCRVIFPHPHNSVMLTVPVKFVLCINKQV